MTANNDKNRTFSVWYVPEVTGTHKVSPQPEGRLGAKAVAGGNPNPGLTACPSWEQVTVLFAGQHIAKSPFEVYVDKSQGDASKVTAQGPGLEPSGNIANKTTYFEIFTAGERRVLRLAGPWEEERLEIEPLLPGRCRHGRGGGGDPGPGRPEGYRGASAGGPGRQHISL